jgi:hypothetical protein
MISSLVQCQLSYINTTDPNFVGGTTAIAQVRLTQIKTQPCVLVLFLLCFRSKLRPDAP